MPASPSPDSKKPDAPGTPGARPALSALAVSALVLAVVPCCPATALIGAFLGMFALGRIQRSGGRLRGAGLATSAMIVGVVGSFAWMLMLQKFAVAQQEAQENAIAEQIGKVVVAAQAGRADEVRAAWFEGVNAPAEADVRSFGDEMTQRFGTFERFSVLSTSQSGSFMAPVVEVAGIYRAEKGSPIGSARFRMAFGGGITPAFRLTRITVEDAERGDIVLGGE